MGFPETGTGRAVNGAAAAARRRQNIKDCRAAARGGGQHGPPRGCRAAMAHINPCTKAGGSPRVGPAKRPARPAQCHATARRAGTTNARSI